MAELQNFKVQPFFTKRPFSEINLFLTRENHCWLLFWGLPWLFIYLEHLFIRYHKKKRNCSSAVLHSGRTSVLIVRLQRHNEHNKLVHMCSVRSGHSESLNWISCRLWKATRNHSGFVVSRSGLYRLHTCRFRCLVVSSYSSAMLPGLMSRWPILHLWVLLRPRKTTAVQLFKSVQLFMKLVQPHNEI